MKATLTILFCSLLCGMGVSHAEPVTGWATWYSRESVKKDWAIRGKPVPKQILMANGQPLNDRAMTCALWITGKQGEPLRPDGSSVKIKNVRSGASVFVVWTDNGPGSVPRSRGVIVDLSKRAMLDLAGPAGIKAGRVRVTIERVK